MLTATTVFAQQNQRPTPEQRAQRQVQWMVDELKIDSAQKEKAYNIILESNKKMTELRKSGNQDREKMRALRTEQDEALKKVLSAEQFDKYNKHREEMRANRRGGNRPPESQK